MLLKEAVEFGKISSNNTKMPDTTYPVDAFACKVGSKLRKIEGSVCSACYTIRLQKLRPCVDKGYKKNLFKWQKWHTLGIEGIKMWIEAIAFQILRAKAKDHRWFDGGDLQSLDMLLAIEEVAKQTPEVRHWLPTKEYGIYNKYLKENIEPDNLVIRVSAPMIDGKPNKAFRNTSTVYKNSEPIGFECKARTRGNACGSCRACWSKEIKNVSYSKH
jgi:hypothetical protein